MGKTLTIHGADFSQNGISISTDLVATPYQGYVITNPSNTNYGILELSTSKVNSICAKILIQAGKSALIWVNNGSALVTNLNLGYVASPNDIEMIDSRKVTDIAITLHPADASLRESDGKFLIQNNTENDLYFYMNFCYDVISGPAFSVSDKHIFYNLV